ncbi:type II toxin-antitoxin system PemK/MazF family toxin, partial [Streptomyces sp. NPDC005918]
MDTSWWLALAAVVVLALVVTLVDGWGRGPRVSSSRPPGRTRPP